MAWTGLKATGPILFESFPVTIDNVSGNPSISYLPYFFSTGGLVLDSGQKYVAFLSAAVDYTGSPGEAAMAVNFNSSYSGGEYVWIHNQYDFSRLTKPTENWNISSNEDAIFIAHFDSTPIATPEPTSLVMVATGGVVGLFVGLRRLLNRALLT